MKSLILAITCLLLSSTTQAQLFFVDLIGSPKNVIIKKMNTVYKNAEYTEESTKTGEKFSSFLIKPTTPGALADMVDYYFKDDQGYKVDYISASTKDINLIRAAIDEHAIIIIKDAWITKDKKKKIILKEEYTHSTIQVSLL